MRPGEVIYKNVGLLTYSVTWKIIKYQSCPPVLYLLGNRFPSCCSSKELYQVLDLIKPKELMDTYSDLCILHRRIKNLPSLSSLHSLSHSDLLPATDSSWDASVDPWGWNRGQSLDPSARHYRSLAVGSDVLLMNQPVMGNSEYKLAGTWY